MHSLDQLRAADEGILLGGGGGGAGEGQRKRVRGGTGSGAEEGAREGGKDRGERTLPCKLLAYTHTDTVATKTLTTIT